jgi:hypothetical protein
VRRAVLRGEDAAEDLVGRAGLKEGHVGDIAEPSACAGERHSREADRKGWGDAD